MCRIMKFYRYRYTIDHGTFFTDTEVIFPVLELIKVLLIGGVL